MCFGFRKFQVQFLALLGRGGERPLPEILQSYCQWATRITCSWVFVLIKLLLGMCRVILLQNSCLRDDVFEEGTAKIIKLFDVELYCWSD